MIAQEIEKVLPKVAHEDADGLKGVSYCNTIALLIEVIKELSAEIEELKKWFFKVVVL